MHTPPIPIISRMTAELLYAGIQLGGLLKLTRKCLYAGSLVPRLTDIVETLKRDGGGGGY